MYMYCCYSSCFLIGLKSIACRLFLVSLNKASPPRIISPQLIYTFTIAGLILHYSRACLLTTVFFASKTLKHKFLCLHLLDYERRIIVESQESPDRNPNTRLPHWYSCTLVNIKHCVFPSNKTYGTTKVKEVLNRLLKI